MLGGRTEHASHQRTFLRAKPIHVNRKRAENFERPLFFNRRMAILAVGFLGLVISHSVLVVQNYTARKALFLLANPEPKPDGL